MIDYPLGCLALNRKGRTLFPFAAFSRTSSLRPMMYTVAPLFSRAVAIIKPIPGYDHDSLVRSVDVG